MGHFIKLLSDITTCPLKCGWLVSSSETCKNKPEAIMSFSAKVAGMKEFTNFDSS